MPISWIGLRTPVDDSLWHRVTVSYLPVSSFSAIISGFMALPHSTSMMSVFLPQACSVLANLSAKAPLTQARAFSFTMLLPTMSNQRVAEEVVTVGCSLLGVRRI